MSARRISLLNFKGGVGKTTLCVNLATSLAHFLGKKVLVVDMDSQSNTSLWLMGVNRWTDLNENSPIRSVWGIFEKSPPSILLSLRHGAIQDEKGMVRVPSLDLLPSVYRLMDLEHEYVNDPANPYYWQFFQQLCGLFDRYDYVLFDCPPNVFRATQCAIFCSDEVYVPANPDILSYVGLSMLADKLEQFNDKSDHFRAKIPRLIPQLGNVWPAEIRAIILNNVDSNANFDDVVSYMRNKIIWLRPKQVVTDDADVLTTRIRHSVFAARAADNYIPAVLREEAKLLREDYINLARYIDQTPLKR